uniref:AP complex subunit sigma n=1 Tax=Pyropia yezoensis TaxID=2788 RepID=A0A1F7_PYRYE|nr:clathrin-associated adaptor complex AP-1 small chain sigma 1 [Neopyropia yezoensis]
MMHWMMLISRQGKVRLSKWFDASTTAQRATIMRDVVTLVLPRPSVMCNVVEWTSPPPAPSSPSPSGAPAPPSSASLARKLIYRRYASLYFVLCISDGDNELSALETVHLYVESLDKYFGHVCELDVIFNFDRAYFLADELLLGGHLQETNRATVLRNARAEDELDEKVGSFQRRMRRSPGSRSDFPC